MAAAEFTGRCIDYAHRSCVPVQKCTTLRRLRLLARQRPALKCCKSRFARSTVFATATSQAENNTSYSTDGRVSDLRVAVFSAQNYVLDFLQKPLKETFPTSNFLEARLDIDTAVLATDYNAVCLFVNDDGTAPVLEKLADLGVKFIAMRCAGFDRVDLEAADRLGIKVVRVPSYSPRSIAEHALTLALCLNRNIHLAYNRVREGNYTLSGLTGREIHGKTVGIVGIGAIGSAACHIFKGMGCTVLAYDIQPNVKLQEIGVNYVDFPELLQKSDIVSLHCPLLPSTFHIMDADRIKQMKEGALLINTSRGGLIDTDALIDGLESGCIGGVALDVYEKEGNLFFRDYTELSAHGRMQFWDRKFQTLKSFPNVLITPHSAFLTTEALHNIAATTIENLTEFALKKPLTNEVKLQK